eukprot:EG_transcript_19431
MKVIAERVSLCIFKRSSVWMMGNDAFIHESNNQSCFPSEKLGSDSVGYPPRDPRPFSGKPKSSSIFLLSSDALTGIPKTLWWQCGARGEGAHTHPCIPPISKHHNRHDVGCDNDDQPTMPWMHDV